MSAKPSSKWMRLLSLVTLCLVLGSLSARANSSLAAVSAAQLLTPIKTESPRDSLRSFMTAMEDYRRGIEQDDPIAKSRLRDAIRLFDLDKISYSEPEVFAERAAIFLKETIDRVIAIDYDKVPGEAELLQLGPAFVRWRLKDTEIKLVKQGQGSRQGEWLFSNDTLLRASEFYRRVRSLSYVPGSGGGAAYVKPWLERELPAWLQQEFFFIPNWQFVAIFFAIFLGLVVKKIVVLLVDNLKRLSSKSKNPWDDRVIEASEQSLGSVASSLLWLAAIRLLGFDGHAFLLLDVGIKLLLSFYVIQALYRLVGVFSEYLTEKAARTEFPLDDQLVPLISKSLRIFTVVFGSLVAVQNLGVNVMSVLAGLGLGGLAFALAARDACANLFGSIMILTDKPFRVGDWIRVDGHDGTVEEIGFRSTKIRSFYGSQISIPNSQIANANIDNMGKRKYRRIKAVLSLTYDTTPTQMEAFLEGLKNIVLANPFTVKENFHVVFESYGESSLNVLFYVFLDVGDWGKEMLERQNLYLEILRLAEELGVEFAFPTRSVWLHEATAAEPSLVSVEDLKEKAKAFAPGGDKAMPKGQGLFTPSQYPS